MLVVHTAGGESIRIDLEQPDDARAKIARLQTDELRRAIRAVSLHLNGVQYAVPLPRGWPDPPSFAFEEVPADPERKIKGGERLLVFVGDISVVVMGHRERRAVRISIARTGKRRYSPGPR